MRRLLVLTLIVLASIASIISLAYPVPTYVMSSHLFTSVRTAINPEVLIDYSTGTVSCAGSPPKCYQQIAPFTLTETWSGQTTNAGTIHSTSTTYVPIAISGIGGNLALLSSLILLFVSLAMLVKNMFADRRPLFQHGKKIARKQSKNHHY
jgi:hypothetical protein